MINKKNAFIFIDTSAFIANNYLEGRVVKQLLNFSEDGLINILLHKITYFEVLSNFRKDIEGSIEKKNAFDKVSRAFRNLSEYDVLTSKINVEKVTEDFKIFFDREIIRSNIIVIDYPVIDISRVFDKYFTSALPFSSKKKSEFPDAFTILHLEDWCKKEKVNCYIYSKDSDMINYISDRLKPLEDIDKYVSDILTEIEIKYHTTLRLDTVKNLYSRNSEKLKDQIANAMIEEVENEPYSFLETHMELYSLSLESIDVDMGEYTISSISENEILLESSCEIYLRIIVTVDDETSGYRDDDTREWIYTDTVERIFKVYKSVTAQFMVSIPPSSILQHMDINFDKLL